MVSTQGGDIAAHVWGMDMRRLTAALIGAGFAALGTVAAAGDWSALMTAEEAASALKAGEGRVVDIRHKELGFDRGRIPGAVSIPFWRFREAPGAGGAPTDMIALTERVRRAGLELSDPILIAHSGLDGRSFAAASWVYWVLKSSGFERLAILDGGVRGWREAGLPLDVEPARYARSDAAPVFSDRWLATTDEVERIAAGDMSGDLLDSRAEAMRDGRSILGAVSYAFTNLLAPSEREALSPVDMLERLKYAEVDWQAETVVTFCNDGLQGAATWFMASEVVGVTDVKLYAASLNGWEARDATD
ncbi:MAG: rhodanese-like domain-containing protein [Pseudomonadota bacterium]